MSVLRLDAGGLDGALVDDLLTMIIFCLVMPSSICGVRLVLIGVPGGTDSMEGDLMRSFLIGGTKSLSSESDDIVLLKLK